MSAALLLTVSVLFVAIMTNKALFSNLHKLYNKIFTNFAAGLRLKPIYVN